MDFAIIYRWRDGMTRNDTLRMRDRFIAWNPPAGLTINRHYHFARGGGIAVVQTDDSTTLFEALTTFSPLVEFTIEPIVDVMQAVAISLDVEEWVESLVGEAEHEHP